MSGGGATRQINDSKRLRSINKDSKCTTVVLPFTSPAKTIKGSGGEAAGGGASEGVAKSGGDNKNHSNVVLAAASHQSSRVVLTDDNNKRGAVGGHVSG